MIGTPQSEFFHAFIQEAQRVIILKPYREKAFRLAQSNITFPIGFVKNNLDHSY